MSRIVETFNSLKIKKRKGFVAYITAGDPTLEFTESIIQELSCAGVDILEIGVPFSDPLADGPVIQEAVERALEHNTSISHIFEIIKRVRKTNQIPLVLFTYLNPVFQYGIENFAKDARDAGIDGVLILDLPPEESSEIYSVIRENNLDMIFIASPTTESSRLDEIVRLSTGFIYYVSHTGVTGEQSNIDSEIKKNVNFIKSKTEKPVAIGFGVSNSEQVKHVSEYGDAVVVGSAIVRRIKEYRNDPLAPKKVAQFVNDLLKPLQ